MIFAFLATQALHRSDSTSSRVLFPSGAIFFCQHVDSVESCTVIEPCSECGAGRCASVEDRCHNRARCSVLSPNFGGCQGCELKAVQLSSGITLRLFNGSCSTSTNSSPSLPSVEVFNPNDEKGFEIVQGPTNGLIRIRQSCTTFVELQAGYTCGICPRGTVQVLITQRARANGRLLYLWDDAA